MKEYIYSLGLHAGECRAFVVDGQQVGLVRPDVMKEILNHPQVSLFRQLFFRVRLNICI